MIIVFSSLPCYLSSPLSLHINMSPISLTPREKKTGEDILSCSSPPQRYHDSSVDPLPPSPPRPHFTLSSPVPPPSPSTALPLSLLHPPPPPTLPTSTPATRLTTALTSSYSVVTPVHGLPVFYLHYVMEGSSD